jgi:hypothetical protein
MSSEKQNMELMQTLDDAWNNQDWDTFDKRHKHDTVVRWPAQAPTHGIERHREEGVQMFKTFPDNRVENRPYKVFFCERRLDVLHRPFPRNHDRCHGSRRWDHYPADREKI